MQNPLFQYQQNDNHITQLELTNPVTDEAGEVETGAPPARRQASEVRDLQVIRRTTTGDLPLQTFHGVSLIEL
jgi:hypothetical protein